MSLFISIWIISLGLFLLSFKSKNVSFALTIGLALTAFVLAGVRSYDYPDTEGYMEIYNSIKLNSIDSEEFKNISSEYGYNLIIKLLFLGIDNVEYIFLISALVSFSLLLIISRNLKLNFSAVWLLYYSSAFLTRDLGQTRLSIACLLVVLFMTNLNKITGVLSYLCSIFALQLLSGVSILMYLVKIRRVIFLCLVIPVSIICFYYLDFSLILRYIPPFYLIDRYEGTSYISAESGGSIAAIVRSLSLLLFSLFFTRKLHGDENVRVMNFSLLFSLLCYITFYNIPIIAQRFGAYFISVDVFMLSLIFLKNRTLLTSLGVVIYSTSTFVFLIINTPYLQERYTSILEF